MLAEFGQSLRKLPKFSLLGSQCDNAQHPEGEVENTDVESVVCNSLLITTVGNACGQRTCCIEYAFHFHGMCLPKLQFLKLANIKT